MQEKTKLWEKCFGTVPQAARSAGLSHQAESQCVRQSHTRVTRDTVCTRCTVWSRVWSSHFLYRYRGTYRLICDCRCRDVFDFLLSRL